MFQVNQPIPSDIPGKPTYFLSNIQSKRAISIAEGQTLKKVYSKIIRLSSWRHNLLEIISQVDEKKLIFYKLDSVLLLFERHNHTKLIKISQNYEESFSLRIAKG